MNKIRAIIAGAFAVIGYLIILLAFALTYLAEGFVRIADWISVEKSPWWGKPLGILENSDIDSEVRPR